MGSLGRRGGRGQHPGTGRGNWQGGGQFLSFAPGFTWQSDPSQTGWTQPPLPPPNYPPPQLSQAAMSQNLSQSQ
eukprot:1869465-Rhodomonas_salina.1